jgi:hypothetical protein
VLAPNGGARQPFGEPFPVDLSSDPTQPAQGPSADAVVLGGGLAGLYGAYRLSKAGLRVIVVEREFEPGGILRGHWFHGHRFSLAEAPLSTNDDNLATNLAQLLPAGILIPGATPPPPRLRCDGVDVPLPCRLKDILPSLPPTLRGDVLLSQLGAGLWGRSSRDAADAEEVLRRRFGAPLCQLVLKPELELYWGVPLKEMAPAAASLPMRAIFDPAAPSGSGSNPVTLRGAPEVVVSRLTHAIQSAGGRLFFGAEVEEVRISEEDAPHQIVIRDLLTPADEAPSRIAIETRAVLSTIPLRPLVRALGNRVPAQVHASSYHLNHLPVQAYACLINKERCLDSPTLHFRGRPFLRITEPRLFAESAGESRRFTTLILVEVSGRSQHSAENWQTILAALEAEKICEPVQVLESKWFHSAGGHPILRKDAHVHLQRIFESLDRLPDLALAGACGRFACIPPAEAMSSADRAADALLDRLSGERRS